MIRVSRPILYEFEVLCDGKVGKCVSFGGIARHITHNWAMKNLKVLAAKSLKDSLLSSQSGPAGRQGAGVVATRSSG